MVVLFLFCYHWSICVCAGCRISELLRLRVQTAAVGYEIWTCYLCVGLHSHRIRSCSETLQGCAVIVRQEGRTGATVWREVVWFRSAGLSSDHWEMWWMAAAWLGLREAKTSQKLLIGNKGKCSILVTESDLVWMLSWSCDFSTLMHFCGAIMLYLLFFTI